MIARANNPPRGPDIPTPRDDLRVRGRLAASPGRRTGPLATATGMAGSCATRSGACGRCSGLQPPVRGGRSCRIDPTVQVRVTTSEPSGFGIAPRHDGPAADRTAPPVRCGRPPDGPEAGSRVATATLRRAGRHRGRDGSGCRPAMRRFRLRQRAAPRLAATGRPSGRPGGTTAVAQLSRRPPPRAGQASPPAPADPCAAAARAGGPDSR